MAARIPIKPNAPQGEPNADATDPRAAEGTLDEADAQSSSQLQLDPRDEEIRRLEEEVRTARDQELRARADLENARRRARQEREEAVQFGQQDLWRDLLPVLDNFERALAIDPVTVDSLREGVELTLRQMQTLLKQHGVEPVPGIGQPFDAKFHDAIMRAEPSEEHPAGTIVDEMQRGYLLRGRLLRPSLVKVAQDG